MGEVPSSQVEAARLVGDLGEQLVVEDGVLDDVHQLMLLDQRRKWQLLRVAILLRPVPVLMECLGRILMSCFLQVAEDQVIDVVRAQSYVTHGA